MIRRRRRRHFRGRRALLVAAIGAISAIGTLAVATPARAEVPVGFVTAEQLGAMNEDALAREGLRIRAYLLPELARSAVMIEGARDGLLSGSFVSAQGLILTHSRAAASCSAPDGTEQDPWPPDDGFLATSRSSERPCPTLRLASDHVAGLDDLELRLVHVGAPALASFGGAVEKGRWPRHAMPYAFLRAVQPSSQSEPSNETMRRDPHEPSIHLAVSFEGYRPRGLVVALAPRREGLVAFARIDGFSPGAGEPRTPYATTLASMGARLADVDGYRLPDALAAQVAGERSATLADRRLGDVVVNFATTLPAGEEMAGTPIADGHGRLVGMVYAASTDREGDRRAIAVDVRGLVDLLIRGYGAVELATELGLGR